MAAEVPLPPGYVVTWSDQFEYLEQTAERLQIVVPVTLLIIFLLLPLNLQQLTETAIVMLSLPFALIGGLVSSTILTLVVIPAVYGLVKGWPVAINVSPGAAAAEPAAATAATSSY